VQLKTTTTTTTTTSPGVGRAVTGPALTLTGVDRAVAGSWNPNQMMTIFWRTVLELLEHSYSCGECQPNYDARDQLYDCTACTINHTPSHNGPTVHRQTSI